jgi:hypothetical protein
MERKTALICRAIVAIVAFICITLAAKHFQNDSLLWFYVVPFLIAID